MSTISQPPASSPNTEVQDSAQSEMNKEVADLDQRPEVSPTALGLLLVSVGCLAGMYYSTFVELVDAWNIDPTYSHGFVVPIVSAAIAYWGWQRYQATSEVSGREVLAGTVVVIAGTALHYFALFVGNLLFDVVGLILILRGGMLIWGGQSLREAVGFSATFLIFMAPLPVSWYQPIAIFMQQLVSVISAGLLDLCGVACYREGYLVHLPGYTMEVGEACSGLRQLTAVLALSAAIGYFSGRGMAYRWGLVLFSIPIAIVANCIRVVLTGFILLWFGKKWAEGVFHTLEGLVIVALAAALVLLAAWGLARLADSASEDESQKKEEALAAQPQT